MSSKRKSGLYWLFLIPFIATLVPSIYSKQSPTIAGFPFFYWWLILWIVLVAVISGVVYLLSEPTEDS